MMSCSVSSSHATESAATLPPSPNQGVAFIPATHRVDAPSSHAHGLPHGICRCVRLRKRSTTRRIDPRPERTRVHPYPFLSPTIAPIAPCLRTRRTGVVCAQLSASRAGERALAFVRTQSKRATETVVETVEQTIPPPPAPFPRELLLVALLSALIGFVLGWLLRRAPKAVPSTPSMLALNVESAISPSGTAGGAIETRPKARNETDGASTTTAVREDSDSAGEEKDPDEEELVTATSDNALWLNLSLFPR